MQDALDPTSLFKCLADETRLRIALLIAHEGELCVCELVAALDESQPKISRHLAHLRACGLLADRRRGQWVYYRENPALAPWARVVIDAAKTAHADWLRPDLQRLAAMGDRPRRNVLCCPEEAC
ncbi:metalloregulator ArsR/SmtB family transcription factor [Pseudomonas sp. Marseille-QA0892]